MRKIIFTLLVTAFLACTNTETPAGNTAEQTKVQQPTTSNVVEENPTKTNSPVETNAVPTVEKKAVLNDPARVMLGTWPGRMNNKALTIVIEKIDGKTLTGYNILGTNKRNLIGTFTDGTWDQPCTKAYEAVLSEPGDDKWDGVFTIKFVGYEDVNEGENGYECLGNLKGLDAYGKWKSNNGKKQYEFQIDKRE